MDGTITIAHRGYGAKHIKNTKEAFENAIYHDFDMIETDIQLCSSGEIVLIHDIHINGKFIKDLTLLELKVINPYILTISDFYKISNINSKNIYFDLKGENFHQKSELVEKLFAFFLESDIDFNKIWIASFNIYHIHEMIRWKMHKYFKIGLITSNNVDTDFVDELNPYLSFISIEYSSLNKFVVKKLQKDNLLVFTFTCHSIHEYSIIKNFEVNGICTDILID